MTGDFLIIPFEHWYFVVEVLRSSPDTLPAVATPSAIDNSVRLQWHSSPSQFQPRTPSISMSSGGPRPDDAAVSHSIALVLKACSCVELTCQLGNTAARSTVRYLAKRHHEAGNSMVKAVTGQLLAKSISLSRLVRGVSDELGSMIWWPRMGAELYEVVALHRLSCDVELLPDKADFPDTDRHSRQRKQSAA